MRDRSAIVWDLNVALIAVSTVFIASRLYVRLLMVKNTGWDDGLALVAWALLVGLSACEMAATHHGSGKEMSTLSPNTIHSFFILLGTEQVLYFLGTGCVRLSIVAFLPRLSKDAIYIHVVRIVGIVIALYTFICTCVLVFECTPVVAFWDKDVQNQHCITAHQQAILMYTHASLGVLFDVILLAMPMWVLYSKMMWSITTVKVALIFSVGIFAMVTGVIRLTTILNTNMAMNTTYNTTYASVWTDLEGHCGLWVASFPALQPILRQLSFHLGFISSLHSRIAHKSCSAKGGNSSHQHPGARRWSGCRLPHSSYLKLGRSSDGGKVRTEISAGPGLGLGLNDSVAGSGSADLGLSTRGSEDVGLVALPEIKVRGSAESDLDSGIVMTTTVQQSEQIRASLSGSAGGGGSEARAQARKWVESV